MNTLIDLLLGYLLGSIPFGLLLTRFAGVGDIRAIGSGNIGATNVLRTGRKGLAAATLLLDGGKGAAAVFIAGLLPQAFGGGPDAVLWAGIGAVLGHLFPVWLQFRGGKGVATGLGVLLALSWKLGLIACLTWAAMAALSRISSLAALSAFAVATLLAPFIAGWGALGLMLVITVLIFARHHANISRLLAGIEPRIGAGK